MKQEYRLPDNSLNKNKEELATIVTDLQLDHYPELVAQYGEEYRKKAFDNIIRHIKYLDQAARLESKLLFSNYLSWAKSIDRNRGIPVSHLFDIIVLLKKAIEQKLGEKETPWLTEFIDEGLESLRTDQPDQTTFLLEDNPLLDEAKTYLDLLLNGKRNEAAILIDKLVEDGTAIKDIYEYIFQQTQYEVGALWQYNKVSVAHEHYCTAATQLIMSNLYPKIFSMDKNGKKLVACSVADELHEIGIRMVSDFFEMDGWDTYYLGANMPDEHLVQSLRKLKPDLLAISVALPIHIGKAEELIRKIRDDETIKDLYIMLGGYSISIVPDLWKKIGANATANSAKEAIKIANKLVTE